MVKRSPRKGTIFVSRKVKLLNPVIVKTLLQKSMKKNLALVVHWLQPLQALDKNQTFVLTLKRKQTRVAANTFQKKMKKSPRRSGVMSLIAQALNLIQPLKTVDGSNALYTWIIL